MSNDRVPPLMACGHAANAVNAATGAPSCAICVGLHPGAEVVAESPDLAGRVALCAYTNCRRTWQLKRDTHYGKFGADGRSFAPSSTSLPFFKHRPDQPHDEYFCGCWGWD